MRYAGGDKSKVVDYVKQFLIGWLFKVFGHYKPSFVRAV